MSSRNIIQIAALAAIACAGAITGVTLGVTDSGYAALPPATARDPAPPIPPARWAEIMHRDPQLAGWRSVSEYLDAIKRWKPRRGRSSRQRPGNATSAAQDGSRSVNSGGGYPRSGLKECAAGR